MSDSEDDYAYEYSDDSGNDDEEEQDSSQEEEKASSKAPQEGSDQEDDSDDEKKVRRRRSCIGPTNPLTLTLTLTHLHTHAPTAPCLRLQDAFLQVRPPRQPKCPPHFLLRRLLCLQ